MADEGEENHISRLCLLEPESQLLAADPNVLRCFDDELHGLPHDGVDDDLDVRPIQNDLLTGATSENECHENILVLFCRLVAAITFALILKSTEQMLLTRLLIRRPQVDLDKRLA